MKRILFLTPELSSGGAERQMVTVACMLKSRGYDIEFLVYSKDVDFYSPILVENGITIHWQDLPNYLNRIIEVRRFIRRGGYDVVVSFLEVANFLNNIAAVGGHSWKVVNGERNTSEHIFHGTRGKIFCFFQRMANSIVCNSDMARQMWLKHYPQYEKKLKVIYNTVTLREITSSYTPRRNNKLNIVVAATLYDVKNPDGLTAALATMTPEERQQFHIDWYGKVPTAISFDGGKAYSLACDNIKKHNLQETITLHEASSDIHNLMNQADLVALFSHREGLPNVILEGMMVGKPIVMTTVSDYQILVDNTNGILCNSHSSESIKAALLKAASLTTNELLAMGQCSKQKAENLFSAEKTEQYWIELFS